MQKEGKEFPFLIQLNTYITNCAPYFAYAVFSYGFTQVLSEKSNGEGAQMQEQKPNSFLRLKEEIKKVKRKDTEIKE